MLIELQDIVFVYRMKDVQDIKWHTRHHRHPARQFELHYFIGGEGHFRVGGTLHNVQAGGLFICPPRIPHAVVALNVEDPISYYAILFEIMETEDARELESLLYAATSRPPRNIGRNYRFFFEELKERSRSSSPARRQAALFQLISFLFLLGDGNVPTGEPGNIHLERALDIMQEQVYGTLRLPDVAGKLGITESYMIRLFRKKLNITPMKYYTRLKVEAAAALLADTPLAVYEIADRLNFYSEYHFSRVFKHYTGSAPTVYRNEQYQRRRKAGEIT
jgi:AraC-like DNA-binding protein